MYNPENLELPDEDDPRLTEYVFGSDELYVHALAVEVFQEVPFVYINFQTPFRVNVPFHFIMWPQVLTSIESQELFDIDQLNPRSSDFAETKARVLQLMGVDPKGRWQPSLAAWREMALAGGYDRLAIVRYRVRFEWTVRAWQGLTLEHLKSEMESAGWALDFFKEFEVSEDALLLETTEPEDPERRSNSLKHESPITPGSLKINRFGASSEPEQPSRKELGLWSRLKSRLRF